MPLEFILYSVLEAGVTSEGGKRQAFKEAMFLLNIMCFDILSFTPCTSAWK